MSAQQALLHLRAAAGLLQGLAGQQPAQPAPGGEQPSEGSAGSLAPCPSPWCAPGSALHFSTRHSGEFYVCCQCGMRGPPAADEQLAALAWNTRPDQAPTAGVALVPWRKRVRLGSAPYGLFMYEGTLAVKSEYGPCDCYIVSSGEYFVGGVPKEKKHALLVTPLRVLAGPLVDEGGAPNLRR